MLSIATIRKDNPHFVGEILFIRLVMAEPEDFRDFGYTMYLEVGCTGNIAHAGYNFHPVRNQWELGCN